MINLHGHLNSICLVYWLNRDNLPTLLQLATCGSSSTGLAVPRLKLLQRRHDVIPGHCNIHAITATFSF